MLSDSIVCENSMNCDNGMVHTDRCCADSVATGWVKVMLAIVKTVFVQNIRGLFVHLETEGRPKNKVLFLLGIIDFSVL